MALLVSPGANPATSGHVTLPAIDYRKPDPFTATTITWNEYIAATAVDWAGFYVKPSVARTGYLHVAVGAAGAEIIIATVWNSSTLGRTGEYIPIPIPAGSRVSVGYVGWTGNAINDIGLSGVPASTVAAVPSFTNMDMGPIYLDGTGGDYADPVLSTLATANNTKSAWTEISYAGTNATPNNILNGNSLGQVYEYLGISLSVKYYGASSPQILRLIDVAHGLPGAEVPFIEDYSFRLQPNVDTEAAPIIWVKWGRPAGDRISFRYQVSDITVDSGVRAMLYGVR